VEFVLSDERETTEFYTEYVVGSVRCV